MAMLLLEGFEWLSTDDANTIEDELSKYQWFALDLGSGSSRLLESRTGYQGLALGNGHDMYSPPLRDMSSGSDDVCIFGMYVKTPSSFQDNMPMFHIYCGATVQVELEMNSDGTVDLKRGTSTLLETSSYAFSTSNEYYVEFKIRIDDSGGYVVMKVADLTANGDDANTVTEWTSGTSYDTKETTNANTVTWNAIRFLDWSTGTTLLDDIYVCDASGSDNNDFLGNLIVEAILPDGDGTTTDFTPSAGDNYQNVDETGEGDDDTSYNESSTDGDIDLYTIDNISGSGSVLGVQVQAEVKVTSGDPRKLKLLARSGSTTGESSQMTSANDEYYGRRHIFEQNPDTSSAWTNSEVNSAEIGIERDA